MYFIWNRETDQVEPAKDIYAWSEQTGKDENRRVGLDMIGTLRVSTVFLGMEHSGDMFETMVFDDSSDRPHADLICVRYHMAAHAREGHKEIVDRLRNATAAEIEAIKRGDEI